MSDMSEEELNKLLSWLHPDREQASKKYTVIHRGLILMLTRRGCEVAEDLADKTFDIVARRAQDLAITFIGPPERFFRTVADNLFKKYRKDHPINLELPPDLPQPEGPDSEKERLDRCLDQCGKKLPPAKFKLVLEFHDSTIAQRKELARSLGIEPNALRIRVHRIRRDLRQCIEECLESDTAHEIDHDKNPY
jgi:DNA-directed RNA polymerase specialized sigma24 family protein